MCHASRETTSRYVHHSIDELAAEHRRTDRLRRDAARPPLRGLAVVTEQECTLSRFAELA
jgi:hypothetical protein